MSNSASRVIGIIRLAEPSLGLNLSNALDDDDLGSLLASLVGKKAAACRPRWLRSPSTDPRRGVRRTLRANLARLRDDLQRQYHELAAS